MNHVTLPIASEVEVDARIYPDPRRAWHLIAVLSLLFVVSYVDRYMVPLLAVPIAEELGLSDTQLGVLLGVGFAILFSLAGIPLAYLLDRRNRILILASCVLLWSLSTIASAFATDFVSLLVCRSGVALGEAVLFPAAISLVADLFPPKRRTRPLTIMSTIAALMGGGAFFLGAAAVSLSEYLVAQGSDWAAWRLSLVIVGLPGILIAIYMLLTIRDPDRGAPKGAAETAPILPFLRRNWRFYVPYFFGLGLCAAIALGMVSWGPVILARGFGMATATAGYVFGLACLIPAAAGTPFWGWYANRGGALDGPVRGLIAGGCVMTVCASFVAFAPSSAALFGIAALVVLGGATLVVLPAFIVHTVAKGPMHAQLTALNLLATSTVGLIGGPLAIPLIARNWPGDPFAIAKGLSVFAGFAGSAAVVALLLSRAQFRRMLGEQAS